MLTSGCEQRSDWEIDTYYVGTDGTEGVGTTHIEMSAIEPQENFDVIEAIGLDENKTEREVNVESQKTFQQAAEKFNRCKVTVWVRVSTVRPRFTHGDFASIFGRVCSPPQSDF